MSATLDGALRAPTARRHTTLTHGRINHHNRREMLPVTLVVRDRSFTTLGGKAP
jgi:hypothetical protein